MMTILLFVLFLASSSVAYAAEVRDVPMVVTVDSSYTVSIPASINENIDPLSLHDTPITFDVGVTSSLLPANGKIMIEASDTELSTEGASVNLQGDSVVIDPSVATTDTMEMAFVEERMPLSGRYSGQVTFTISELLPPPGTTDLVGGDLQAGFYGEVSSEELISGDELAAQLDLSAGVSQNSDVPWLKFSYNNTIQYTPLKPIRHTISWNDLNNAGLVFGDKTIDIDGNTYKVRLFKGTRFPESNLLLEHGEKNTPDMYHGSEWNRLMAPIHDGATVDGGWRQQQLAQYLGESDVPGQWYGPSNPSGYSDADFGTTIRYPALGSSQWAQETIFKSTHRITLGSSHVINPFADISSEVQSAYGWRPVLELVN